MLLVGAAAFGAVAAAGRLPELLEPARDAFTTGLTTVAGIGAVLLLGLAVLAASALRHVPPSGPPRPDQAGDAEAVELAAPVAG